MLCASLRMLVMFCQKCAADLHEGLINLIKMHLRTICCEFLILTCTSIALLKHCSWKLCPKDEIVVDHCTLLSQIVGDQLACFTVWQK